MAQARGDEWVKRWRTKAGAKFSEQPQICSHHPVWAARPKAGA